MKKTGGFNGYLGIFICACSRVNRQSPLSGYSAKRRHSSSCNPIFSGYNSKKRHSPSCNPIFSGYSSKTRHSSSCNPIFSGYSAKRRHTSSCNPIFSAYTAFVFACISCPRSVFSLRLNGTALCQPPGARHTCTFSSPPTAPTGEDFLPPRLFDARRPLSSSIKEEAPSAA